MDLSLSEEQEMLRTMARDFLMTECPEDLVRRVDKGYKGYSPELWRKIADLGWLGLIYPEEYGGTGGNFVDLGVLHEEMGRGIFQSPFLSTVVLCGQLILTAGNDEQKSVLLPKIVKGDLILSLALPEPESVWDGNAWEADGVKVSAVADRDDYVINGIKLFIHDAHVADYILCVARTKNGTNPEDGITIFLVDAKSPEISCTLLSTTAGDNKQSEIIFENVRVPKNNIIGELHMGWNPLAKVLQIGAIMLCAEMVGAGQRAVEIAVDYAKTRIQFDMPIGINQWVQEHAVQLVADVDTSRWVTYYAAWMLSENLPCELEVAIAKAWCSEHTEDGLWHAHDILSGIASTTDAGILPLLSTKASIPEQYLGSSDYWREKIVQQLEKLPPPEKPKGKLLGIWDHKKEQWPTWDIWQDYVKKQRKSKED